MKDITDGTSNTISLGEARISIASGDSRGGGYGVGAGSNGGNAAPSVCAALVGTDGKYTSSTTNASQAPGVRWADSEEGFTSFFTFAAPNYPRCGMEMKTGPVFLQVAIIPAVLSWLTSMGR